MEIISLDSDTFVKYILEKKILEKDIVYFYIDDTNKKYMFYGNGDISINDAVLYPITEIKDSNNLFSESLEIDHSKPSDTVLVSTKVLETTKQEIYNYIDKKISEVIDSNNKKIEDIKNQLNKNISDTVSIHVDNYIEKSNIHKTVDLLKTYVIDNITEINRYVGDIVARVNNNIYPEIDKVKRDILNTKELEQDISNIKDKLDTLNGVINEYTNNINSELKNISSCIVDINKDIDNNNKNISTIQNTINKPSGVVLGQYGKINNGVLSIPSLQINSKGICTGASNIKVKIKNIEVLK